MNRYLERGREDFAATGLSRRRPFPVVSLSMIMLAVSCDGNGVTGPSPDPSPSSTRPVRSRRSLGLPSLAYFMVHNNRLTGTLPSLTGLTNLVSFNIRFGISIGNAGGVEKYGVSACRRTHARFVDGRAETVGDRPSAYTPLSS